MSYDAMANEEAKYQDNRPMQGNVSPAPKKDRSNVEEDLDDLRSAVEYLHMRLDTHEKKLFPVLRADFDSEAGPTPDRESSSHLDNALRTLLSSVKLASDRVSVLTERLDI